MIIKLILIQRPDVLEKERERVYRMQLLRKISSFGGSIEDIKHIYVVFIRSILETSSLVRHTSLTKENENDLERIQKTAFRLILGSRYNSYKNSQSLVFLSTLKERRKLFTLKSLKLQKINTIFRNKDKEHPMETRSEIDKYKVDMANTERLRMSAGIQMQITANKYK